MFKFYYLKPTQIPHGSHTFVSNKNKHENTFQYMSNSHSHSYKGLLEELEPNPSTYFMIKLYYMKPTKSHVEIILQYQKILIKKTPSILCPSSWAKGWLRPQ